MLHIQPLNDMHDFRAINYFLTYLLSYLLKLILPLYRGIGILVVVAIGVALGVFCGGLLLACVVVYMKRSHSFFCYHWRPRKEAGELSTPPTGGAHPLKLFYASPTSPPQLEVFRVLAPLVVCMLFSDRRSLQ